LIYRAHAVCFCTLVTILDPLPIILATQDAEIRWIIVQSQPGQTVCETLSQTNPVQNRAGGVAQLVECLTSKH
jgi:hypothetical protein